MSLPRRKTLTLFLFLSLTRAGIDVGAAQENQPTKFAGRSLTVGLLELEKLGLRVLFTSQVVKPEMKIASEPRPGEARFILDQLLAPHNLEAHVGPGGLLVIVPRATTGSVVGHVRERASARPVADVQIFHLGGESSTFTRSNGSFELTDLAPGPLTLQARRPGFTVESSAALAVVAGQTIAVDFELSPAPLTLDEIIVTPSSVTLLAADPIATLALSQDEILAMPNVTEDLFRALALLPGTASSEISAELHVRGGRADEVMVVLDQLELFEPYHLRDFNNALTIVAPRAVGEVELILGGFPACFGDRMGGVLDMRTVEPGTGRGHFGLSPITAQLGASGQFAAGRGSWLGTARLGSIALISSFLGDDEKPSYWDTFAKVEFQMTESQRLGGRLLLADDRLDFSLVDDGDREQARTSYGSSYAWLVHQAVLGERLFVDTVLARGLIDRDRQAGEGEIDDPEVGFLVRDARRLEAFSLKQDWNFASANDRHWLRWGFDLRRLESHYDYFNDRVLDDPLAEIRSEPRTGTTRFKARVAGEQYGFYLSERLRLGPSWTVELGWRYDEQTITGDRDTSPRLNLMWAIDENQTLRFAWGHYFQSQRPYELRVEDGETNFLRAERTEQWALGYERRLGQGASIAVDLYDREVKNPRPRFENIFEPVSSFPEIEPDRVRIAAQRGRARGVELFLRGPRNKKLEWWLNYTFSQIHDVIAGRTLRRGLDQPHALNADLSTKLGAHWKLNFAFRWHTGWPTTQITGKLVEDDEGELEAVPAFGPINGERLADYHRLDLRLSREWRLKKGQLTLFVDIQNVYNRRNLAGYDVDFDLQVGEDGSVAVDLLEVKWSGILPSIGFDWQF